jgi:2-methylisocitrate lyase-like PEP mutase family enzyme
MKSLTGPRRATAPRRFRELLARGQIIPLPGATSALAARLIEEAGFDAVYMTGSGLAAEMLALPDVGLTTMTEVVREAHAFADAVQLPVIADADTGYGNAVSVMRTVREFEKSGVAGIHIEDQVAPKRCGHFAGKALIPMGEMEGKVRAACDARHDQDFVIIARCDALGIEPMEAAIARGEAYAAAGADALWFDAPTTMEQIETIGRHFGSMPLVFNMSSSGRTPFLTVEEVGRLGYRLMVFPVFTTLAAIKAMQGILRDLKETGDVNRIRPACVTFDEYNRLIGLPAVEELEHKYGEAGEQGSSVHSS